MSRQEGIHQHVYQGLRKRGETDKVALIAIMRKLPLHLQLTDALGQEGAVTGLGPVVLVRNHLAQTGS